MIFHKQGGKMRRNANDADRKSGKLYGWLLYYSMYYTQPCTPSDRRRTSDADIKHIIHRYKSLIEEAGIEYSIA